MTHHDETYLKKIHPNTDKMIIWTFLTFKILEMGIETYQIFL